MKKITLFIIIGFLSQTHFASSASLEGTYPNNSALYGTPTVMSFDMQSMQLCESVSPSTGACVGDNTYTFTNYVRVSVRQLEHVLETILIHLQRR